MPSKSLTFNAKVIALINEHELHNFSVVQLRDIYLKSETKVSENKAYTAIYKSIWIMHKQGLFEKRLVAGSKSFTYSLAPNFKQLLDKSQMSKNRHANGLTQPAAIPLLIDPQDAFIEQMLAKLPQLENEMLAKKAEAQEYQYFLSKLPNHKDMLMKKFNEANTAVVKLIGRITATQRVLGEFR